MADAEPEESWIPGRDYREYEVDPEADAPLLSTGQASKILNVSSQTVINWANEGRLPSARGAQQLRRRHLIPEWAAQGMRRHLLAELGDESAAALPTATDVAKPDVPIGRREEPSSIDPASPARSSTPAAITADVTQPSVDLHVELDREAGAHSRPGRAVLKQRISDQETIAAVLRQSRGHLRKADDLRNQALVETRAAYDLLEDFISTQALPSDPRLAGPDS